MLHAYIIILETIMYFKPLFTFDAVVAIKGVRAEVFTGLKNSLF
jgi:hypothetical protein